MESLSSSSFSKSVSGGFVSKARWERKVSHNKKIEQEKDALNKKYLELQRDLEDSMSEFGENL